MKDLTVVKEILKAHPKIAGLAAAVVVLIVIAFGLVLEPEQIAAMAALAGLLSIGIWYAAKWAFEPFRRRRE